MKAVNRRLLALAIAVSGITVISGAWAHGDEHIDPNMKVDNPIMAPESAFGRQGITREVARTLDIAMTDAMKFTPATLDVKQGETVRLRIRNDGRIPHEFVLGTKDELTEHAELMKKNPDMEHADANTMRVAPGKTAEIIWQFTQPGTFLYVCLIPGHWDTGMQGTITVTGANAVVAKATGTMPMAGMSMAANDMKSMPVPPEAPTPSANDDRYTQGVIRKVDAVRGKLTIKHGDIKNLGMPGMTMMFSVKDPSMMQGVREGDAVHFVVERINGALMIIDIKKTAQ
ncbi:MAG: copper-binding protein [Pseudomonadota bacterium]